MGEASTQQIFDLVSAIGCDVAGLEASINEILVELQIHNRDMSLGKQYFSEVSQNLSGALPT